MNGEITVPASRDDVWRALTDPRRLAGSLPGVDDVEIDDDGTLRATVRPDLGLGPAAPFTVRMWAEAHGGDADLDGPDTRQRGGEIPSGVRLGLRLGEARGGRGRGRDLTPPPDRIVVRGRGTGAEYAVDVTAELRLSENGDQTTVRWRADVRFSGVLASVGQRVLVPIVSAELECAAHRLAAGLTGRPATPVEAAREDSMP